MGDVTMNHDVVASFVRQLAKHRFEHAVPFDHVHNLIRLTVAIEVRVGDIGLDVEHADIMVEEQRNAIHRRRAARRDARRQEMPVAQRRVGVLRPNDITDLSRRQDRRRREYVIQHR